MPPSVLARCSPMSDRMHCLLMNAWFYVKEPATSKNFMGATKCIEKKISLDNAFVCICSCVNIYIYI